jgi:hypothetical protein
MFQKKRLFPFIHTALILLATFFAGCSTYIAPSGRADLASLSSASHVSIRESFAAKPAAQFPAHIAAARIQASGYRSYSTERQGGVFGEGRYSVITVQELDEPATLQTLSSLPQIGGFIHLSRLLLPPKLQSDVELREAAARLKADMLLLYTFDTSFHDNDASVALNVITLGLSPTRKIFVHVTGSALLLDTRTGFIHAALESSEHRELRTNAWESRDTADRARQSAEAAAFRSLLEQFQKNWPQIVDRAGKGA